ncbi:MAG: hypothetical protein IAE83_22020 [Anaerolinea sp.]|nr:hypothetical protein [Anaerolinea sp.]
MKLPNYERCEVPEAKITKYLLNLGSINGKSKAQFFLAFGFTIDKWEIMAQAFKQHAADHEVTAVVPRQSFGTNYVIEGALLTPDGRNPLVRVIWTINVGGDIPRLTSAYPLKEA